ncbi:copper resistance protein CopC/CopD [Staphylococcus sp. IVB6214]|uniref:copper resistance CopC/CopD family protein n=1 Tax=Staphylococcus sp. IVB6214 TaxID=2989766 RepID=UPI0021D0E6CA|nr:copper resistance protein CopC/CopD [Staphylococcus sp. IVB6214]UXR82261.1 copper resistance protein CopC/CopD [Staphylococcus sp. IVB6214]
MSIARRTGLLWGILIAMIFVVGGYFNVASAHVSLENHQPMQDEVVSNAPDEIKLKFSDPVNVRYTEVQLYNDKGHQVEQLHSDQTGYSDTVIFRTQQYDEGTYAVKWQAVSPDGHEVSGQYQFSIGTQTAKYIDISKPFYADAYWWLGVLRFVMQGTVLLLTGLYIVNRIMAQASAPTFDVLPKYRSIAWILVMLIGATSLVYLMTLSRNAIQQLLRLDLSTWISFPFLLAMVALMITVILFSLRQMEPIWYHAMPVLILISLASSGHVWAQDIPLYALLLRTLHLVGIAVWLGSFIYLYAYIQSHQQHSYVLILRDVLLKTNIGAVIVIIVTGLLMSIDATSIQAIVTQQTTYSVLWLTKISLTIVLMGLGAIQTFWAMNKKRKIQQPMLYFEIIIGVLLILAGVIMSQIAAPL